jgi:hypothetical protein
MLVWVPRLEGQGVTRWRVGLLACAALRGLRRRAHAVRDTVQYEKIEGLRADIIKETLKGWGL